MYQCEQCELEVGVWERQLVPLHEHIHDTTGIRPSSAAGSGHRMNFKEESSRFSPAMKLPSDQILIL